jgi:hypothetical protein
MPVPEDTVKEARGAAARKALRRFTRRGVGGSGRRDRFAATPAARLRPRAAACRAARPGPGPRDSQTGWGPPSPAGG